MRGGTLLAIFFIISLLGGTLLLQEIKPTGNAILCTANWTCSDWSNCIGGEKIRTCVDTNLCGITLSKPNEKTNCESGCIPNWQCSDWTPEECPEEGVQTKSCTDTNNCGTDIGLPESVKECEHKQTYEWLFYVIVTLNILTIFLIIALIIGFSIKSKNPPRRIISQREIPITPKIERQISKLPNQYPNIGQNQPNPAMKKNHLGQKPSNNPLNDPHTLPTRQSQMSQMPIQQTPRPIYPTKSSPINNQAKPPQSKQPTTSDIMPKSNAPKKFKRK